jgi:thymidylate kinase
MNIVIEGCDGTGKSSIAKHLCERFNLYYWHESQPRTFDEYKQMLECGGFVFDRFCFGQFVYNASEERKLTPEELKKLVTEVFAQTGTILLYVDAKTDTIIKRLIQRGEGDPKQISEMEKWIKNIRGTYRQVLRESGSAYIEINGEGGNGYV